MVIHKTLLTLLKHLMILLMITSPCFAMEKAEEEVGKIMNEITLNKKFVIFLLCTKKGNYVQIYDLSHDNLDFSKSHKIGHVMQCKDHMEMILTSTSDLSIFSKPEIPINGLVELFETWTFNENLESKVKKILPTSAIIVFLKDTLEDDKNIFKPSLASNLGINSEQIAVIDAASLPYQNNDDQDDNAVYKFLSNVVGLFCKIKEVKVGEYLTINAKLNDDCS